MILHVAKIPLSHGCRTCWLENELKIEFAFNIRVSRMSAFLHTYQPPC